MVQKWIMAQASRVLGACLYSELHHLGALNSMLSPTPLDLALGVFEAF